MKTRRLVLSRCAVLAASLAVLGAPMLALADDKALEKPPKLEPLPDVPPPPNGGSNIEDPNQPTVTARTEGSNRIEEFRVHGKLYAIRVTPKVGAPYVLVDPDGTGNFIHAPDQADDVAGRTVHPPRWVLFEF